MSFETIKNTVKGYIETKKEIKSSKELINQSEGRVSLTAYDDSSNYQGKQFGPVGYYEDEIDAIKREIKNASRIVVSGENGTVTIINRSNKNK